MTANVNTKFASFTQVLNKLRNAKSCTDIIFNTIFSKHKLTFMFACPVRLSSGVGGYLKVGGITKQESSKARRAESWSGVLGEGADPWAGCPFPPATGV